MLKKIFSSMMAIVLVVGLLPTVALADTDDVVGNNAEDFSLNETSAVDENAAVPSEIPDNTYLSVAPLATDDIDSGTIGTCTWVIDADGCLTIAPEDGVSGEFYMSYASDNSWPWYRNSTKILSAKVESGVSASGSLSYMFNGCTKLVTLDLSDLDTSNVTNMSYMFYYCTSLTTLDLSGLNTSNVTNMYEMFYSCSALTTLDLTDFDTSNITSMSCMFCNCSSLISLDLSDLNTSNVTNMNSMFSGCSSLISLDLSGLDTSNVTNMSYMFYNCSSLITLDLSGLDTSFVTSMYDIFYGCSSLVSLNLSGLNASHVTDMSFMFYNCSALTVLDLLGFDTSSARSMWYMFYNCSSLTSLDLSSFDTSNVTDMGYMFYKCTSLTTLDLSSFDTSKILNTYSINVNSSVSYADEATDSEGGSGGFDASSEPDTSIWESSMFEGCSNLRTVVVGEKFTITNYLPTPKKDGKSGRWMSDDGTVYETHADLPSNVAATYTAVFQTPSGSWSPGFYDVCLPKEWYFDSVYYMAELGIITGYNETTFGVGDPMTRAQLVTIMWRYCEPDEYATYNEATAKNTSGLSDVPDGMYYTGAVNWAVSEGVVTGNQLADGSYVFSPDSNVSFEQMVTIVARYVLGFDGAEKYDTSALNNGAFTDAATVSDYARGSVAWAIENGVVTGNQNANGTYTIAPLENVARERAATVLARSIQSELIVTE